MKRVKKAVAALSLVCAAAFALAGCSVFGYEADGNFPYDAAVQNGYAGTEAEWLSSQETPETLYRRLYEETKADGSFTGTYFEFLQQLGLTADATPYVQRALLSVVSVAARFPGNGSTTVSAGSGVIYSLDKTSGSAYILTNYHVLYLSSAKAISENITVRLYGYETAEHAIPATYYGGTMEYDLALLRVENSELLKNSDARAADIGADGNVIAGETVYAIGNPLNKNISVSSGVVSMEEDWASVTAADDTHSITIPEIRTDAAVNSGNSGGGLFNALGELVGIVNARDKREEVSGVGYAICIELASAFAQNVLANGGKTVVLHDGMSVVVEDSKGVYDETLGRTHVSQKLCVSDYNAGAGPYLGVKQGDTLISGYVERSGVKCAETIFTHRCAWEAFRFQIRQGDVVCLTVSRGGEQVLLSRKLDQPVHFDVY